MLASGLWYPVYDRHLAWVGVRLETDTAVAVPQNFIEEVSCDALAIEGFGSKLLFLDANLFKTSNQPLAPLFPPSQLVIVVSESFLSANTNVEACIAWRGQGARLAITGLDAPSSLSPDTVSMRILNAATARVSYSEKALLNASRSEVNLFAQGIGSMSLFDWCAKVGFSYFTFAGLDFLKDEDKPQDTSSLPIMQLLSLVTTDADTAEIEEVFKRDPKLAFELLRLVNSSSFGMSKEITSFAQAIMILGQRQLQRWLQLLMFAQRKKGDDGPNILMQRAAERGRIMELLAAEGNEKADPEQAFMVGVFSVLDILMATPLKKLLASISLPQPVAKALLEREGRLGSLLNLVCAAENSGFITVRRLLSDLGITPGALSRSQLDAIFWALRIARSK